ncbi:MAG: Ribonuclease Y [Verrucomicrobia subdivision 3 bacterium]|nr:Ribonuclease Y [Limisphaerales bacterium]MCS1415494.1 Ribonuclease Y [Limisphaerales bacterium]
MLVFAFSGWPDLLLVIVGMLLALVGVNVWNLARLRSMRSKGLAILKEAQGKADRITTEAQERANSESERIRRETEARLDGRGRELAQREKQFQSREEILSQQLQSLSKRESLLETGQLALAENQQQIKDQTAAVNALIDEWQDRLAGLAELTQAEAREELLRSIERDAQRDARDLTRRIVEKAKRDREEEARRIISIAIQRYAGDHTSETTTASVALKGDDIKGRIIGREGRNIRAFENVTGMTVLIDDTPNTVVLSGFDPVRREIARESMERLIADGRIHPTRIEEVVGRVSSEIEDRVLKMGDEVVCKLRLSPVHPEISKRLGRLYFRQSYSQNVLDHSVEVARLTALIASELGANVTHATRAGLLHDVGKALGDEIDGSHAIAGAEFIRRHGESDEVANAVASHHDEVEYETVLGILVSAADAISASRPGARSESIASYVSRLKDLEEVGMSFAGVERCFAVQAGREVRVFVRPEEVADDAAYALARDMCRKIEEQVQYPGQIRVMVIREVRCVDYAK